MRKKSFTLLELIIVVVIVAVLGTIGYINFRTVNEKVIDKEAKANLKLIQAAQNINRMEMGTYANCASASAINTDLKLSLPTGGTLNWSYSTDAAGTSTAIRSGRTWTLTIGASDPLCSPCVY